MWSELFLLHIAQRKAIKSLLDDDAQRTDYVVDVSKALLCFKRVEQRLQSSHTGELYQLHLSTFKKNSIDLLIKEVVWQITLLREGHSDQDRELITQNVEILRAHSTETFQKLRNVLVKDQRFRDVFYRARQAREGDSKPSNICAKGVLEILDISLLTSCEEKCQTIERLAKRASKASLAIIHANKGKVMMATLTYSFGGVSLLALTTAAFFILRRMKCPLARAR